MPTKSGAYVYYEDGSNAAQVHVANQTDTIIQPIEIQSRYAQTIQTHNAVSIPATTGVSTGAWIDCDSFSSIGITCKSDVSHVGVLMGHWSNDGSVVHYFESISTGSSITRGGDLPIKARYFRLEFQNTDAAAHTVSAWAYLKS